MKKRLSIPLVLCAAGLVYALVGTPPQIMPEPRGPVTETPIPDAYAGAVSVRQYGETGELEERTDADYLRRFTRRAVSELENPRRWGYGEDGPWQARALRGEILEQRDVLRLNGEVSIHYPGDDVEFTTEAMNINLERQIARSLAPVRVWQESNETLADSLHLDLAKEVATLNGNVRTYYAPEP